MGLVRLFFLTAAALLFAGSATAASPQTASAQSTAPAASSAGATPAADSGSHVLRATLDNGLQVVIARDPLAPVATQQVTYFAGGNQSPEGFPGIAHAQEHMMFRGAPGLSANQLAGIYARMGGDMNAFTTNNITSYFFTVPGDDIGVALRVGAIRMAGVDNAADAWAKERGAIEQEVARDHSSAMFKLRQKLRQHMFAGTPYANSALGTKESFDKLTAKQLANFHDTWYAPNNAMLVVAGDVDPEAVLAKVKKLYGDIPRSDVPEKPDVTFSPVEAATFSTPSDQPFGIVLIGFRMPGYESPDYPAAKLASKVLSSQRGPIAALRYKGKALAAGFAMQTMPDIGIGFAYAIYPSGGKADKVKDALVDAIKSVREDGIDSDVIKAAKRRAVLAGELRSNSISGLAMAWTSAIALAGLDSPADAVARLRQVTPEQVNAQVRKQLDLEHAITLIAKPTPGTEAHMGGGFGGKESFAAKPEGEVVLPDWAEAAFAQLPHPEAFLEPTDLTLDNGLRLIVQPLDVSNSISLFGSVHQNTDLQAPENQEGVGRLLDMLFAWGPRGMDRLDFEKAKDQIGARLSLGSQFSLKVLPKYFDDGVDLLARATLHPALPKRAFARQKMLLSRQLAGRMDSPKFKFSQAVQKALLPEGDPALRLATADTLDTVSLGDVHRYYDKVFRPDVTTIVVMGDITPAKAKAVVSKYFGDWEAEGPKPDLTYPEVPLSKKSHTLVPDELKKQNQVVMAETVDINFTNPDHFALELAADYLSGGFYATPLYHVLREKLGLVYNVGASFDFDRNRGSFSLHYGSYPDKVDEARTAAIGVLKDVMSEPLTDDELHLAKSIGLRQIQLSKQSVGSIGWGWISRSNDGLPLDQSYIKARHYENLTADQIHTALNKYFDPERLSTIVLGQPVN